ncbi:response regulator transcription factor [Streptomyces sp. NPDC059785]|uniref:response regulator transcription factor n=1 Tax=unclassified Streptomyces TaxID=2593676 RepID=UPI003650C26F
MPAVLPVVRANRSPARPKRFRRVSALHGRLRALGRDDKAADRAVTACVVWLADVLLDIADEVPDQHAAAALRDEASAALASLSWRRQGPRAPAPPAPALTERELMVARRLQEDASLREIADELFVSYNTVKTHVRAVYSKLGACSRADAVRRARELRLL